MTAANAKFTHRFRSSVLTGMECGAEYRFMPVARSPHEQCRLLFNHLASRFSEKLEKMMSQEFGMHSLENEFFAVIS